MESDRLQIVATPTSRSIHGEEPEGRRFFVEWKDRFGLRMVWTVWTISALLVAAMFLIRPSLASALGDRFHSAIHSVGGPLALHHLYLAIHQLLGGLL
jgi:hypothetical protein